MQPSQNQSEQEQFPEEHYAAALEVEWSDYFFPEQHVVLSDYLSSGARGQRSGSPLYSSFYKDAAEWATALLKNQPPLTLIEAGAGTGRFAFEMFLKSTFSKVTLIEPHPRKAEFLERLFLQHRLPASIPFIVDQRRTMREVPVASEYPELESIPGSAETQVFCSKLNEVPPQTKADLVVSLNVIDHVSDPASFCLDLTRRVSHNGRLLLSSPLDWISAYTHPSRWRNSLEEFLPPGWCVEGMTELPFVYRSLPRRVIIFHSQVIMARHRSS